MANKYCNNNNWRRIIQTFACFCVKTAPSWGNREKQHLVARPQSFNERAVPTQPPSKYCNTIRVKLIKKKISIKKCCFI